MFRFTAALQVSRGYSPDCKTARRPLGASDPARIARRLPEKHQRHAKVPLITITRDIPGCFGRGEVLRHPADSLDHVGLGDVRPAAAPLLNETAGPWR